MAMKVDYKQAAVITLTDTRGRMHTFHLLEVEELYVYKNAGVYSLKLRGSNHCIYITKEDYYELKEQLDNCNYMKELSVTTDYKVVR